MKRFLRIAIIFSFLITAAAPAISTFNFDEPPTSCPPNDPKCKPPIPPLE